MTCEEQLERIIKHFHASDHNHKLELLKETVEDITKIIKQQYPLQTITTYIMTITAYRI